MIDVLVSVLAVIGAATVLGALWLAGWIVRSVVQAVQRNLDEDHERVAS